MKHRVNQSQEQRQFSRRDFLKLMKAGAIDLALLAAGGAGYGFLIEPAQIKVESVNLRLRRLTPSFFGIRLVQISDIHMGSWMNADRLRHVVDLVTAQTPDVVLLTGDFLVGHHFDARSEHDLQEMINILSPLARSIPSFAVLGNHDYWTNVGAVREMLKSIGIVELTNSVSTLTRGNEHLHLCGVDDVWEGDVRLDKVLDQLKGEEAAILLAHEPDFADTSAATEKFDLQVSGHSHGGQIVIPFVGPPILPYLGWKYPSGLYQVGNMIQYTNRGVGTGRLAMRINCPPEITLFTLESQG